MANNCTHKSVSYMLLNKKRAGLLKIGHKKFLSLSQSKVPAHLAVSQHAEDQGSSFYIMSEGGREGGKERARVTGSLFPIIMGRVNLCTVILSPASGMKFLDIC